MAVNYANPSHEEVWDDSLLIDSWNQALEEYKKYHSIHAKGGSIRDLEQGGLESSKTAQTPVGDGDTSMDCTHEETQQELKQESVDEDQQLNETDKDEQSATTGGFDIKQNVPSAGQHPPEPASVPPVFPSQAILGSMRDDNLKKLLMSWYYAGYYTGLVEGQQQALQQQQKQP